MKVLVCYLEVSVILKVSLVIRFLLQYFERKKKFWDDNSCSYLVLYVNEGLTVQT